MTDLATSADIEARLGRDLTAPETLRLASLLADASAAVRAYTGQEFDQATTTARLRPRGGVVVLPQRPVTDVTAVADADGNEVTFTWDGDDRVDLSAYPLNEWEINPRRYGLTAVDATYEHGYEATPPDVLAVVCGVVIRALGSPPDQGGHTQESIQGYSYTIGVTAAAGPLGFLVDERKILERYRRSGGSARLAMR